ncbi:MAG: hypothetical protein AAFZ15_07395 [Bacteroidota bacterium]
MKKRIGIWLDYKEANIIILEEDGARVENILSEIELFHPKGGARSKSPYGPMDKILESKFLARRKLQEKAYYEKLMDAVKSADELFVFGPAEAKDGLLKAIKNSHQFRPELKGFERADSMTKNQKVAKVRAFFTSAQSQNQ